jgi:tripartite-type tricarboxylate transporter receptor subunit TctC
MMDDAAIRASFTKVGLEPVASVGSPADFARYLEATMASWGKTVREANIKVELK